MENEYLYELALMNGARITISQKSTTIAATIHYFTKALRIFKCNIQWKCSRVYVCMCMRVRVYQRAGMRQRLIIADGDRWWSPTRAGFHHDEVTLVSYLYLIVCQIIYPVIHSYSSCGSCTRNCAYICFFFSLICILRICYFIIEIWFCSPFFFRFFFSFFPRKTFTT